MKKKIFKMTDILTEDEKKTLVVTEISERLHRREMEGERPHLFLNLGHMLGPYEPKFTIRKINRYIVIRYATHEWR